MQKLHTVFNMDAEVVKFILWFDIGWLIGLVGFIIYLYFDSRQEVIMENSDFINERNKILSELDNYNMDDIINYSKKYNIKLPDDENVILAGLHKARLYIINPIITDEMKETSKAWLIEHGFNPFVTDESGEVICTI